jgi:hypothetical protein
MQIKPQFIAIKNVGQVLDIYPDCSELRTAGKQHT